MADLERRIIVVVYRDGRAERHRITPSLEMEFERLYGVGIGQAFTGAQASTNLSRLAWLAVSRAPRNGAVLKTIEGGWVDELDCLNIETETFRPFELATPAGSSHNSVLPQESLPAS